MSVFVSVLLLLYFLWGRGNYEEIFEIIWDNSNVSESIDFVEMLPCEMLL